MLVQTCVSDEFQQMGIVSSADAENLAEQSWMDIWTRCIYQAMDQSPDTMIDYICQMMPTLRDGGWDYEWSYEDDQYFEALCKQQGDLNPSYASHAYRN